MIAFGCSITAPEIYERFARPGIEAVAEPGSPVLAYRAMSSLFRSYNLILDRAAPDEDLEALVLVHQDTELVDPGFCAKVREVLADPEVAVAGCIGALGADIMTSTPEHFAGYIKSEQAKWAQVIRESGAKAE